MMQSNIEIIETSKSSSSNISAAVKKSKIPITSQSTKKEVPSRRYSSASNCSTLSSASRIPIYNGNKGFMLQMMIDGHHYHPQFKPFGSNRQQSFSSSYSLNQYHSNALSDLKIMDLPEHVRIHQNLHNRLNHQSHRTKEISSSLPSTPGSFTSNKVTDTESSSSIMSSSTTTTTATKTQDSSKKKKRNVYEEYLPLCEMQKVLQKGEIVEGILRINQRNYNDAYISAPEGGLDIFINGLNNRNRALNGDCVAVQFLDEDQWMISYTIINLNWNEWKDEFENLTKTCVDVIDFEKLNLNSKDINAINHCLKSNPQTSKEEFLRNQYSKLPIEIFSLKIPELKNIDYWKNFIQRTGKVVGIINQNHPRVFAGVLKFVDMSKKNKNNYTLFHSRDIRNPPIIIPNSFIPDEILKNSEKYKDNLFLAQSTKWELDSIYPKGKLLKHFGDSHPIKIETEIMLRSYGIEDEDFPEKSLEEYRQYFPNKNWVISDEEIAQRKDLRQKCIFTIDPETAKDLDDAVSYEKLPDGRIEVGVHIADVSFFIGENTMLDNIARDRATSVYLVSKVIPMLPHLFCQDLCSLNPGQDKLTFSVIFTLNEEGNILDRWFGRTIINSCCKLSYEHAQMLIDCPEENQLSTEEFPEFFGKWSISDVYNRVRCLNQISQRLRKHRFSSGSLILHKKVIQFTLNDEGTPIAITNYQRKDSNYLIEELMLLANVAVGEFLFETFGKQGRAFLRRHQPFDRFKADQLKKFLELIPFEFKIDSSLSIQKSLEALREKSEYDDLYIIANLMICRNLTLAEYICVGDEDDPKKYHHYALNFAKYTHFTSPIRRYADVIVHRLLSSALGYKTSSCSLDRPNLKAIANHCNKNKYNAFLASEKSKEIYLKAYISNIGSIACKALVIQVLDHSFDVFDLQFATTQRIYTDQLAIDSCKFVKEKTLNKLILKWKMPENDNDIDESKLIQTINCFDTLDIEFIVSEKFEFKVIIAHPNGTFIRQKQ